MPREIIVLDIETTGLNPKEDLILELGMVKLNLESGEITVLFDQVFKDPKLTAKHRNAWIFENGFMQIEEIRNALPISEYFDEIQSLLDPFKGQITAWNRDFDSESNGTLNRGYFWKNENGTLVKTYFNAREDKCTFDSFYGFEGIFSN